MTFLDALRVVLARENEIIAVRGTEEERQEWCDKGEFPPYRGECPKKYYLRPVSYRECPTEVFWVTDDKIFTYGLTGPRNAPPPVACFLEEWDIVTKSLGDGSLTVVDFPSTKPSNS